MSDTATKILDEMIAAARELNDLLDARAYGPGWSHQPIDLDAPPAEADAAEYEPIDLDWPDGKWFTHQPIALGDVTMGKTTHTPGPWDVAGTTHSRKHLTVHAPGMDPVAFVHNGSDRGEADARLVAAAPDMYDALTEVLAEISRINAAAGHTVFNPTATSMARAALGKAEGG
jgi:hypothetical protein